MLGKEFSVLNRHFTDINPVQYGWEICESRHDFGPAYREHFLIHYIIQGKGCFERKGKSFQVEKGSMFLIRPYELTYYQADAEDPWHYIWIGFDGKKCLELLEASGFRGDTCVLSFPRAAALFEEIRAVPDKTPFTETALCAKLYQLFTLLSQEEGRGEGKKEGGDYVRRTVDFIQANFSRPVQIGDIARMLGIDRKYLCRIFSREIGKSPKEFLIQVRLSHAAEYLSGRGYNVGEAARSVGYEDVFNFSKMFKKKYGCSPQRYQKEGGAR